jgi:hypothetical protein
VQKLVCCLLLQALFTERSCGVQVLAPPPSSCVLKLPRPLFCMSFSVPLLLFRFFCFVLWGRGQSVQGAMLIYPRGTVGISHVTYLLTCLSASPKQVWSWCQLVWEPYGFSQCNMAWRSFVWAGGLGCVVFTAKYGSSVSARFLIYKAHTVCFLPLVTILDLPCFLIYNKE